ncbi:thioredoxin domain-containing protein [Agreia sp. COWG]|uniref:DsbA family protein n=1 Tax=Agreia sp. COWG TaxID=2773266 RepID=UPI0019263456|nr:thioredoxin domain-containing protein [Agreia sp. COWG]CAD5990102.1 Thioredoxin-like_fold domain-containing protein [Agreia sp. COWG]
MSAEKTLFEGLSKKDRKALAREIARIRREEAAKKRRRKKIVLRTGGIVVGLAALTVGVVMVVSGLTPAPATGPANMASDGVLFSGDGKTVTAASAAGMPDDAQPAAATLDTSDGILHLVVYADYGSDDADLFEKTNGSAVLSWVTSGYATLELHPVSLLDSVNQNYSTRAANAVACVADAVPNSVPAVNTALAAAGSAAQSADALVALVKKAGVTDTAVADCITSGAFDAWVSNATKRAAAAVPNSDVATLTKTPLIVVNGKAYTGALDDTSAFETFVQSVYVPSATAQE